MDHEAGPNAEEDAVAGEELLRSEEEARWSTEIQEAVEARKQAEKILKRHPRPRPPRGMMQRRSKDHPTQDRVPSTMRSTQIGTTDKS
jgi:hypothetical protein